MNAKATADRSFCLGLAAISVRAHGGDPRLLGGFRAEGPGSAREKTSREWLQNLWGIVSASDLRSVLSWLERDGASRDYHLLASGDPGAAEQADAERRLAFIEEHRAEIGQRRLVAWDACRFALAASWGFLAGFLSEAEAWGYLSSAARRVRAAYSSWAELAKHYVLGRRFWSEADATVIQEAIAWLEKNKQSPWKAGFLPPVPGTTLFVDEISEPRPERRAPESLPDLLSALEDAQAVLRPAGSVPSYRSPATPESIAALAQEFPKLPADVETLLLWHDGQSQGAWGDAERMHPFEDIPLNGAAQMLAIGQARCKVKAVRYLPLYGTIEQDVFLGLALSGRTPGALWIVDRKEGPVRKLGASLSGWIRQCLRLRDGAARDKRAMHPGDVPVTPSQAFKLALSGILTEENGGSHTVLTTLRPIVGTGEYLATLKRWWEISTRGDLLSTLTGLLTSAKQGGSRLAFDAGRIVFLARAGACAFMLEPDEAWTWISDAAALVQPAFTGWDAYARAYLQGLGVQFPSPSDAPRDAGSARPAWDSPEAVRAGAKAAAARLFAPDGLFTLVDWHAPLEDDAPPAVPPAHVTVIPGGRDSGALARALDAAEPGDVFEIQEGVQATIAPAVSVGIFARWGTNPQSVHIVGTKGEPAMRVGDCAVVVQRVMFSAPKEDGIVVEQGALVLDRCLINAPEATGLLLTTVNAKAWISRGHLGGRGVLQRGGATGIEGTTFGQAFGGPSVDVQGGSLTARGVTFELWPAGNLSASGETATLRLVGSTVRGVFGETVSISKGARATLAGTTISGGQVGLAVTSATADGEDLSFDAQHRAAIRLAGGGQATLANVRVRGERCVVAGMTPEGLRERDPRNGQRPEVDPLPRGALVVCGESSLVATHVDVQHSHAPALVAEGGTATLLRSTLWGRPEALRASREATCALGRTELRGRLPAAVEHARLGLLDCRLHVEPRPEFRSFEDDDDDDEEEATSPPPAPPKVPSLRADGESKVWLVDTSLPAPAETGAGAVLHEWTTAALDEARRADPEVARVFGPLSGMART